MNIIPVISTLITFGFAASVLNRWRYKKPNHLLFWGAGLIWYGLGTLSEVLLSFTFSPFILKLWYLSGAMLTAAWLGQGTVYLLVRRRMIANSLMVLLLLATIASVILLASASVIPGAVYHINHPASEQYKEIIVRSGPILFLTILLNIYGTLALVGGALYSAFFSGERKS